MFLRFTVLWFSCKKPSHLTTQQKHHKVSISHRTSLERPQPPHPPAQQLPLSRAGSAWRGRLVVHSPALAWVPAASSSLSPRALLSDEGGTWLCSPMLEPGSAFALLALTRHWNQGTAKGTRRKLSAVLMPWKQILVYPTYSESA